VLIILAGITLNAVIGEDGIIFQAKDTKNMITNETAYDDKQLAQLQNELKDDSIYSGIGLIPGTDTGGSSEGGESGSGGTGGGSGTGGSDTNTGTGGSNTGTGGGTVSGDNAQQPTIQVLEGEEIAASFYRSDITIQISTVDKTQNIKYILTTTVDEINNELYPSGLVKEIDIANGGTLTFTKDGEYTITAYAYDVYGAKSEATIMWLKRETGTTPGNGVTVSIASGNEGLNDWYTSNVMLRVLGTDTGTARVTYRVKGVAYSNGIIGNTEYGEEYTVGEVDTGEVQISNGTTFQIALDGEFAIVAYTYNDGGVRLSTATTVNIRRDASRPVITLYKGEQVLGQGFKIDMKAEDYASNLATEGRYTYRHKLAPTLDYIDNISQDTTHLYKGLAQDKTYDMYVIAKDEAGNMTASDVISKPALWVSSGIQTTGDTSPLREGLREYYQVSNVDVSITGQDENNVDIRRVTYEILGTTTGSGVMQGATVDKGVSCDTGELEMGNEHKIELRADGNWTIKVHTYNKEDVRVTTNTLEVTRDNVTPEPPVIAVAEGTKGDDTYYRSDIKVRVTGADDTCFKKVTYTVTGTATGAGTIGGVSISSGQAVNIGETEIANGTTFDIKADGRWTIKGYTYDKSGRKSVVATGIVITRDIVNPVANTPTISGTVGEATYYRGTPTITIAGSDVTSFKKMTYSITGTTKTAGAIAGTNYAANASVNTGEKDIANNGTFTVGADGTYIITAYAYDMSGRKTTSGTLSFTRDATAPTLSTFATASTTTVTSISATVSGANDNIGLATSDSLTYRLGTTSQSATTATSHTFTGINLNTIDTINVVVKDKAGNTSQYSPTSKTYYLVDLVSLGEYVAYDAGTWPTGAQSGTGWTSDTTTATTNGHFSGYTAGANKGTSVTGATSGWRVLSKTGSGATGEVTLISAGSPANAYKAANNTANMSGMVTALNNFASENYLNSAYASSARNADYANDFEQMGTAGVCDIDNNFWLATGNNWSGALLSTGHVATNSYLLRRNRSSGAISNMGYCNRIYNKSIVSPNYYGVEMVDSSGSRYSSAFYSVRRYSASSNFSYGYGSSTSKMTTEYTSGYVSGLFSSTTRYGVYDAATCGTRPVIVLKPGSQTSTLAKTTFLSQSCWGLK